MARTLETLDLGTAVFCGEQRIGAVSGLYAEGDARAVEWLIVAWDGRGDLAISSDEIEDVGDRGVTLMHSDPHFYDDLITFSEDRFPTVRKLA